MYLPFKNYNDQRFVNFSSESKNENKGKYYNADKNDDEIPEEAVVGLAFLGGIGGMIYGDSKIDCRDDALGSGLALLIFGTLGALCVLCIPLLFVFQIGMFALISFETTL